jgi:competence protein ComEC
MFERIWKPQSKIAKYFWSLIAVSVSAQLGVLPLSLFYFNQFSGLFLASSLVLIPILGLVLASGFFLIVFDSLGVLNNEFAQAFERMISLMNDIIVWLNQFDFLVIDRVYYSVFLLIISYLGLYGMIKFFESGRIQFFKMVLICTVFIQVLNIHRKGQIKNSNELIVFHSPRNTLLGIRKGNMLEVSSISEKGDYKFGRLVSDYNKENMIMRISRQKGVRHFYWVDAIKVLLLDSEFWKLNNEFGADILILSHSPKFNLDRFLENHKPNIIIADGSNYRSFVTRWEHSCNDAGVLFHNTAVSGAFSVP